MDLRLVVVVRGSSELVERCRSAVRGRARLEAVSLRMLPKAVAEWSPAIVLVPEELHGERAARLRAQGTRVVEIDNDASNERLAEQIDEALLAD